MFKQNKELFLFDIIIACAKIKQYSKDFKKNVQDLKYDCKSWDAVIREFETIGEAINNLIKTGYFLNDKREIVDLRNVLIHRYFGIDENEVWDIRENYLDDFQSEITKIILQVDEKVKNKIIEYLLNENEYLDFIIKLLENLK